MCVCGEMIVVLCVCARLSACVCGGREDDSSGVCRGRMIIVVCV